MNIVKYGIYIIQFVGIIVGIVGQVFAEQSQRPIDSVESIVRSALAQNQADSNTITNLCELSQRLNGSGGDKPLQYALQALHIAELQQTSHGLAQSWYCVGDAYRVQGRYYKSSDAFFQSLKYWEVLGDKKGQVKALNGVGITYYHQGNYDMARRFQHLGLALSKTMGMVNEQAEALIDIGITFRNQQQLDSAMSYLLQAIDLNITSSEIMSDILYNLGTVYEQTHDYERAIKHIHRALTLKMQKKEHVGITYCYRALGRIALAQNNPQQALLYVVASLRLADSLGIGLEKYQTLGLLSEAYKQQKNYRQALLYHESATALRDSIFNAQTIQQTLDMQSSYQQEKQSYTINVLQAESDKQTLFRNALIAVGLLLLVVLWILLNRYRLKTRSEDVLKEMNAELVRNHTLLDEQAQQIHHTNTILQEANHHLQEMNIELETLNEDLYVANSQLDGKNEELHMMNTVLAGTNERLAELNNEKNEFLGIAAHDLKNPLALIQINASLMAQYYDNMVKEEHLERLNGIIATSKRMSDIITNLLDVNAIETGNLVVTPKMLNLQYCLQRSIKNFHEQASAKQLSIVFQSQESNDWVFADEQICMQIFDNLISNAVKYSPRGKNVWIMVKEQGLTLKPAPCCLIFVKDEGPGISQDDMKKLFGKFARLSARPTGGEHSTGLGLSIVKKLVEAMNGCVWCESELGKGATFCVELPIREQMESK